MNGSENYFNDSDFYICDESDNSTDLCSKMPLLRYSLPITVLYWVAYLLVFVMGVIGNSCVVAVVFRAPRMRSVTNVFIANLAVADLLVNCLCLPFTLIGHTLNAWVLGSFICKIVPYLQGVSISASINTLVAISVERAMAICCPMKCHMTSRTCRTIIVVIWLFSLTITLPWAIFFKLVPVIDNPHIEVCQEQWPTKESGELYFVLANLIMCYVLPLTIISICYIFIWHKVWVRKMPGEQNTGVAMMMQRSKIKVIKMLLMVVILFAFSWFPLYVIFARLKLGNLSEREYNIIWVATPIAQWLGTSNSCINPILYAFFNNRFREGFKAILLSRSCCSPIRLDPKFPGTTQLQPMGNINSSKLSVYSGSTFSVTDSRRKSLVVQIALDNPTKTSLGSEKINFIKSQQSLLKQSVLNSYVNGSENSIVDSNGETALV